MIHTCIQCVPPVFSFAVKQKFTILCTVTYASQIAQLGWQPICFSLTCCCSRLKYGTTVLLSTHTESAPSASLCHQLVKFDLAGTCYLARLVPQLYFICDLAVI